MECNQKYEVARQLTYVELHMKFVWKQPTREWAPRSKGFSLGRVYHVSPGSDLTLTDEQIQAFARADIEAKLQSIRPGSDLAALLMRTKLIIWDEAPMMHKYCFEALDMSLKDIMQASDRDNLHRPFGGKVVVFAGDLRQVLHVIPKGTRQDIVFATFSSSFLWDSCKVLKLIHNMRLQSCSSSSTANEIRDFSEWILSVGDGRAGGPNDGEVDIEITEDILIDDGDDPISSIVDSTYPSLTNHLWEAKYFQERAILAPTNEIVEKVNNHVLSTIPGDEKI
ncbi:uncharacterized protein LOC125498789 [Beta vulgaris subsp. vulgaris]|uniref:uncharacterized protein LOC125498789 n=1 Tax=Beta vulgaris subsp. vulgaris TaxID=3555 RepID=UPI002547B609|nr:uncharacterized protein LOC125498789 [Beta vulgaris subsp. vulgaris]